MLAPLLKCCGHLGVFTCELTYIPNRSIIKKWPFFHKLNKLSRFLHCFPLIVCWCAALPFYGNMFSLTVTPINLSIFISCLPVYLPSFLSVFRIPFCLSLLPTVIANQLICILRRRSCDKCRLWLGVSMWSPSATGVNYWPLVRTFPGFCMGT
jgi:hypothetical protein